MLLKNILEGKETGGLETAAWPRVRLIIFEYLTSQHMNI